MCGRYVISSSAHAIRQFVRAANVAPTFAPNWNVAPTQTGLVVRLHPETGQRYLDALAWGLIPHRPNGPKPAHRPINARAETLSKFAMFRGARRCLVAADAFYEWRRTKAVTVPYAIARQDGESLMLAGLWDARPGPDREILRTYAIITTAGNKMMTPIHARMPVVLERDAWPVWLGEAAGDHLALLRPAGEDVLRAVPVSRAVNRVRNNGAELRNPV
jgi:putative SOS response-associated peptidase YedK